MKIKNKIKQEKILGIILQTQNIKYKYKVRFKNKNKIKNVKNNH